MPFRRRSWALLTLGTLFPHCHCHCRCENCLQCRRERERELFVDLRSPIDQQCEVYAYYRMLCCSIQLKEIVHLRKKKFENLSFHWNLLQKKTRNNVYTQRNLPAKLAAIVNPLRNACERANYGLVKLLNYVRTDKLSDLIIK